MIEIAEALCYLLGLGILYYIVKINVTLERMEKK